MTDIQDFFPEVLDMKAPLIDVWLKTNDDESFAATKRIIRQEGLFVGGSSGTALAGTLRYLASPEGKRIAEDPSANVVVILPDGVRNYMSKPWFLAQAENPEAKSFQDEIRSAIGRDLDDVYGTRANGGFKKENSKAETQTE